MAWEGPCLAWFGGALVEGLSLESPERCQAAAAAPVCGDLLPGLADAGRILRRDLEGKINYKNPRYLEPKSMQNNGPKPLKRAQRAIVLHTFGVQVVLVMCL